MKNQARFHPIPYLTALTDRLVRSGSQIFENTTVVKVEEGESPNVVTELGNRIRCRHVISASHFPFLDSNFSIEEEPLGTGGAIKFACNKTTGKTVLVVNGDTLFMVDVNKLAMFHNMCGADCTLSLKPMQNFDRYGVVELNKDYSIKSFDEKKFYEGGLINGGVYALHPLKFLEQDLPEKFSFEKEYLEKYFDKTRMYGVVQDKYFIDIGIPEDYARAQKELSNK